MSLHIGKISPHVRRDELERVFKRFGHCRLQVKDKFGFVVYDYPVNAERALRTLRGKKICGELLTLSWSNNQPSYRAGNSDGRNCKDESYVNRKAPSYSQHNSRIGHKKQVLTDEPKDARNGNKENDKVDGLKEALTDAGGGPNKNDRWEEKIGDLQNGNELKYGSEFDHYQPCSGGDKRVDDDEMNLVHQGSSPTGEDTQERKGVKQDLDQTRQACYNCGKLGHKMRNCIEERGYKRKLDWYKRNYKSKDEDGVRRMGSEPRGRELLGKEVVTIRSHKDSREADYSTGDNRIQVSPGKQYEKVKRIRESPSPERRAKKSRRPQSIVVHSDDKVSRSRSSSVYSKSATRSKSVSRSRSSSRVSLYATTASGCRSSSPPSLQNDKKDSFLMANSPEQNDVEVRSAQLVENGNAVVHSQVDKDMDANHIQKSEEDTQLDEGKYPKEQIDGEVRSAELVEKSEEDAQLDEGKYPQEQIDGEVRSAQLVEKSEEDTQLDEEKYLSKPLLENDVLNDESLSPTSQRETQNIQSCDLNVSEVNTPSHKTTRSMCLTLEEILMVINHYGLKQPEEADKDLPVESFFGCGRLWPWEVIYYRRLKKGPISVENYGRRIFQNKEFGIVDKFVRSSSGWGEEESCEDLAGTD